MLEFLLNTENESREFRVVFFTAKLRVEQERTLPVSIMGIV